jgi:hypothetical protein
LVFEEFALLQELHGDVVAVLVGLRLDLLALVVIVPQLLVLVPHGAHGHLLLVLLSYNLLQGLLTLLLLLLPKHLGGLLR